MSADRKRTFKSVSIKDSFSRRQVLAAKRPAVIRSKRRDEGEETSK